MLLQRSQPIYSYSLTPLLPPRRLLLLIRIRRRTLFILNHIHNLLHLIMVLLVRNLPLLQLLAGNERRILAQLPHCALALLLVLRLELAQLLTFSVWIIRRFMSIERVLFFEFRQVGGDGEWSMVVEFEWTTELLRVG